MAHLPERIIVLLFVLGLPLVVFSKFNSSQKILGSKTEAKTDYNQQIVFWQNWQQHHPEYRDGFVQLAYLYQKSGNVLQAKIAVQKIFQVDPNFQLPVQLLPLRQ